MKPKDIKVGDTLYVAYYENTECEITKVTVGKVNTNSVYVHEIGSHYLQRYKKKANFPLESATNFIDTSVLTDDPDYADKQNDYDIKSTELNGRLANAYNRIIVMKLEDKQKIYNKVKQAMKEVK